MNALRAGQDAPPTVFEVSGAVALILNMSEQFNDKQFRCHSYLES